MQYIEGSSCGGIPRATEGRSCGTGGAPAPGPGVVEEGAVVERSGAAPGVCAEFGDALAGRRAPPRTGRHEGPRLTGPAAQAERRPAAAVGEGAARGGLGSRGPGGWGGECA